MQCNHFLSMWFGFYALARSRARAHAIRFIHNNNQCVLSRSVGKLMWKPTRSGFISNQIKSSQIISSRGTYPIDCSCNSLFDQTSNSVCLLLPLKFMHLNLWIFPYNFIHNWISRREIYSSFWWKKNKTFFLWTTQVIIIIIKIKHSTCITTHINCGCSLPLDLLTN